MKQHITTLLMLLVCLFVSQHVAAQNDLFTATEELSVKNDITSNPGTDKTYTTAGGAMKLVLHGDFQRSTIGGNQCIFRNTGSNVTAVDERHKPTNGWYYELQPQVNGIFSATFYHKNAGRQIFFYSEDGALMTPVITIANDNDQAEIANIPLAAGKKYYIYTMTSQNLGFYSLSYQTEKRGWDFTKSVTGSGLHEDDWETVSNKDGYLFNKNAITTSTDFTIRDAEGNDLFPGIVITAASTTIDPLKFSYYTKGGSGSTSGLSEDRNGDDGKDYLLKVTGMNVGESFTLNGRASGALDITAESGTSDSEKKSFANGNTFALPYTTTASEVQFRIGRRMYLKSIMLNSSIPTVSFGQTEINLTAGQSQTLTATKTNTTKDISYGSLDETIATVDASGHITAKNEGVTVIYARAGAATASVTVKVSRYYVDAPTLTVNGNTFTSGETTLRYYFAPTVNITAGSGKTIRYKVGGRAYTFTELLDNSTSPTIINSNTAQWQYEGEESDIYLSAVAIEDLDGAGDLAASDAVVLHLSKMDLMAGHTWDFESWSTDDKTALGNTGLFTVSGNDYTFKTAETDFSVIGVNQLEGMLIKSTADKTRIQAKGNGNMTVFYNSDIIKFPIVKGQTFTFKASGQSNPFPYKIDHISLEGTTTNLHASTNETRLSDTYKITYDDIKLTAPSDGWIAFQGTASDRAAYLQGAKITPPSIPAPVIRILSENVTGTTQQHDGTGTHITVSSNDDEVTLWYKWSNSVMTAEQLTADHEDAASNRASLSLIGTESKVLSVVAVKAFGDTQYKSEVVTLTMNYAASVDDSKKAVFSGLTSVWTVQNKDEVYKRTNNASKNADYYNYASGRRWASLDWGEKPIDNYYVEFDAVFTYADNLTYQKDFEFQLLSAGASQKILFNLKKKDNDNANEYSITGKDENGNTVETDFTMAYRSWYHFKFAINKETNKVVYYITNGQGEGGTEVAGGYFRLENGDATGLYHWIPRAGAFSFDNYKVWFEKSGDEYLVFSKKEVTYDLLEMNFTEPSVIYEPESATIEYSLDNTSIAALGEYKKAPDDKVQEVQFFDGGIVNVTGHLKVGGEEKATASYQVTVKAETAEYDVSDDTYTLTKKGKLLERNITMVPGITATFGNTAEKIDGETNLNMTLVKDYGSGLVAQTLANNGWRDFQNEGGNTATEDVPKEGSYMTFKPIVDGVLTVNGARSSTLNDIVMVDATDSYATIVPTTGSYGTTLSDVTYQLTAGHTYHLYGKNPMTAGGTGNRNDSEWTVLQVHAFKFVPDFRFEEALVKQNLDTFKDGGYTQSILKKEGETATYQIWDTAAAAFSDSEGGTGDIRASINSSTGKLTWQSGTGGALIVKCTSGGGYTTHYVLTVPYETHKWDFTTIEGTPSPTLAGREANMATAKTQLTLLTDDWGVTYKVRNYTTDGTQMLYYLNKPVMANNQPLSGDNAIYIDETAGLIIKGSSKSFGVDATESAAITPRDELQEKVKNGDYDNDPAGYSIALNSALRSMLEYGSNDLKDTKLLTVNKWATITLPDLKAGQYIRMHLNRHSGSSGQSLIFTTPNVEGVGTTTKTKTVTIDNEDINVTAFDITGVAINGNSHAEAGYAIRNDDGTYNLVGSYIFKVTNDGDVSLRVDDNGWVDIYDIEVSSEKFDTELLLLTTDGKELTLDETGISYNSSSADEVKAQFTFATNSTQLRCVRATTPTFRLGTKDATVDAEVDGNTLKIKGGIGNVQLIEEVYDASNNVVVDTREIWFAVGQVETQTYPMTWDFTEENMTSSPAESVWSKRNTTNGIVEAAPGTSDNEKTYGAWDGNSPVITYIVNDASQNSIDKPVFVSGAQLTAGTTPIIETIGLGIGVTTDVENWAADGVTLDNTALKIKKTASGKPFIRVPGVKNGQRLYVKANRQPTATASDGEMAEVSDADTENGSYGWNISTSNADGETLQLTFDDDVEIYRVAVTDVTKSVNELGYATESRAVAIDHRLTDEFTVYPVKPYVITDAQYDEGTATVTPEEVNVVPANTGVMLHLTDATPGQNTTFPLFYPAVNIEPTTAETTLYEGNFLRPHVNAEVGTFIDETEDEDGTGTGTGGKYTRFGLTRYFYTYHSSTGEYEKSDEQDQVAFVRMKGNNSGNFGANLAYLRVANVPEAIWNEAQARGYDYAVGAIFLEDNWWITDSTQSVDKENGLSDETNDGVTTGINQIETGTEETFYTINGLKLSGRPTTKGIYIVNGRKVVVK